MVAFIIDMYQSVEALHLDEQSDAENQDEP
jgi:hypothetical protein